MEIGNIGKMIIGIGIVTIIVGLALMLGGKIGLGRLPGDILIRRGNFTFYFPLVTGIIISIILTIILNLIFRR